ncbi:hypothetical protein [uncultured Psychrobacter sp.]|uniref:hypothetical protein n=1 Tax=uncultured Psychrobacter sp. TaxID=259303 RepID=UPI0025960E3E|nr:hypothetical protein [uncultured Psychrobacter sp.]
MSEINHNTTIAVNAFDLEDLHLNQLYQIERIENAIAVARLASESQSPAQLKAAISLMIDSLSGTVNTIKGDHESMTQLIKEAETSQPVSA